MEPQAGQPVTRSLAHRYWPFVAIIALQLLLVMITPSTKTAVVTQSPSGQGAPDTATESAPSGSGSTDGGAPAAAGPDQPAAAPTAVATQGGATRAGSAGTTGTTASAAGGQTGARSAAASTGTDGQSVDALGRPTNGDKGKCAPGGQLQENITKASPPCMPKFVGDNGGNTAAGVSKDTINVVVLFPDYTPAVRQGLIAAGLAMTPEQARESDAVWAAFFEKHYELYGRKLKLFEHYYTCSDAACLRAEAKSVVAKYKPFAVTFYTAGIMPEPMADQFSQMGIVNHSGPALADAWYASHAPYVWGLEPQGSRAADMIADYYCKKMHGKNATLAGDPTMRVKPRRLAVVATDDPADLDVANLIKRQVTGGVCGGPDDGTTLYTVSADPTQAQNQAPTLITRMKNDGITTRVSSGGLRYIGSPEDDKQQYYPENLLMGVNSHDDDLVGQFYSATVSSPAQMQNTFGIGFYPKASPPREKNYYKASRDINPQYEPPYLSQGPFDGLHLLVNLFQHAGPTLTAKNIEAGARTMAQLAGWSNPKPWAGWKCCDPYAPEWKFSTPGSYTAWTDAREIYWSSSAVSPANGNPGSWACVNDCRRYEVGQWPKGEPKQ